MSMINGLMANGLWYFGSTASVSVTDGGVISTTPISINGANFYIATFNSSGTFIVSGGSVIADILVIAGGGSGGSGNGSILGGGGGAGGYQYFAGQTLPVGTYTVTVGAGGAGATGTGATGATGNNGLNSSFGNLSPSIGGGGGGCGYILNSTYLTTGALGLAGTGGSGGGGSIENYAGQGGGIHGNSSNGQGNAGGLSTRAVYGNGTIWSAGGGGGAGTPGDSPAQANSGGGNGGVGLLNAINGTNTYYAGGGGGGVFGSTSSGPGAGGSGGGGAATPLNTPASSVNNGTPYTGGGGGGGSGGSSISGSGGSGIVIVRYAYQYPLIPYIQSIAVSSTTASFTVTGTSYPNGTAITLSISPVSIGSWYDLSTTSTLVKIVANCVIGTPCTIYNLTNNTLYYLRMKVTGDSTYITTGISFTTLVTSAQYPPQLAWNYGADTMATASSPTSFTSITGGYTASSSSYASWQGSYWSASCAFDYLYNDTTSTSGSFASYFNGGGADRRYDSGTGTYRGNVTTSTSTTPSSISGEWLQLQLPNPIILTSYAFTPRVAPFQNNSPGNWYLLGSLTGANGSWVIVDDRSATAIVTYTGSVEQTFTITQPTTVAYSYYRVVATIAGRYDTAFSLSELKFFGNTPNIITPTYVSVI